MSIFYLSSGEVVTDRNPTHVHVGVTPELLAEALAQIRAVPGEQRIKQTIDFGRVIGACTRVQTRPEDEIVFAQRVRTRLARSSTRLPSRSSLIWPRCKMGSTRAPANACTSNSWGPRLAVFPKISSLGDDIQEKSLERIKQPPLRGISPARARR